MTIRKDRTYHTDCQCGQITCPKCDCMVLYDAEAPTRPRYCPDCEKFELDKQLKNSFRTTCDTVEELEVRRNMILETLRMPRQGVQMKTVQEMIGNV